MIGLNNLQKQFKDNLIEYENYVFDDGRSYLILGASGSGKSTLLNLIAGIVSPSEGNIYLDDICLTGQSQADKDRLRTQRIGYIYQDYKLVEDMTVEDNIRILEICGIKSRDFHDVVSELDIEDKLKRKVRGLSGGEKQRVAIARALVKNPDIILADEPTGSLNFEIGDIVIRKLLDCTKGKLCIMVSHDTRLCQFFDVTIDLSNRGDINA